MRLLRRHILRGPYPVLRTLFMSSNELVNILVTKEATALGTLASIVSLAMTVYVLLGIRKIKRFYSFNALIPQALNRLDEISRDISSRLNSFEGITVGITQCLIDAEISLTSLKSMIDGDLKNEIKSAISEIRILVNRTSILEQLGSKLFTKHHENQTPEYALRNIYLSLYRIEKQCRAKYDEARWER